MNPDKSLRWWLLTACIFVAVIGYITFLNIGKGFGISFWAGDVFILIPITIFEFIDHSRRNREF